MSETPLNILLVDDDDDHLIILKNRLERLNYRFNVETAKSGEECLRKVDTKDYDCIVSDFDMRPGMSGIDLLNSLANSRKDIPFVMLSSDESLSLRREVIRQGADEFLTKSDSYSDINGVVDSLEKAIVKKQLQKKRIGELLEELASSKDMIKRYRSIFDQAPHMAFFVGTDGKTIDEANETAAKNLGQSKYELSGTSLVMLISPDQRQVFRKLMVSIFSGTSATDTLDFVDSRGERIPAVLTGSLIKNDGQVSGALLCALFNTSE